MDKKEASRRMRWKFTATLVALALHGAAQTGNEWAGRDVYVRFNSVGHGYYLWVNGQRIGYSEDSYLPSEFNITPYITEGEESLRNLP